MTIKYQVHLVTIDPENEEKDIHYSALVEAQDEDEAINFAKIKQNEERPDLHPGKAWSWSACRITQSD